ncbi:MAG: DMT family transporter [Pseudomonadota bacterium]|nr:DMT family transporter [Pseudomonadota bacterium]
MSVNTSTLPVHLRLLAMAALWGASWPWARVVAQALPPLTASAWRFGLASAALLLWLAWRGQLRQLRALSTRQWLGLSAAAAAGVFGYAALFMAGLQHMPAGRAVVIVAINPAVTLALAAWLFGERLNTRIMLGMALAFGGALITMAQGAPWLLLGGGLGLGEWLMLGCVACWVAYTLMGRVVMQGIDPFVATCATALLGAAMLAAASLATEGVAGWQAAWAAPVDIWLYLLAIALLSTTLAYAWYFEGIKALGAGSASAYIMLVPVFGVALATLWLREPMHISLAAGGAIVVAGMALMHLGRMQP